MHAYRPKPGQLARLDCPLTGAIVRVNHYDPDDNVRVRSLLLKICYSTPARRLHPLI